MLNENKCDGGGEVKAGSGEQCSGNVKTNQILANFLDKPEGRNEKDMLDFFHVYPTKSRQQVSKIAQKRG